MNFRERQIAGLRKELAAHPDVQPGEHGNIVATCAVVRTATLVAALLALPLAVFTGVAIGALLGLGVGGLVFAVSGVVGVAAAHRAGTTIELRYLERMSRRIAARETKRLASANASHSSVAVPALVEVARR